MTTDKSQECELRILTSCADTLFPLFGIFQEHCKDSAIPEVVSLLAGLFDRFELFAAFRDDLRAASLGSDGVVDITGLRIFVQTIQEIETGMVSNEPSIAFGLTEKGAMRWEAAAAPDWNLYIHDRNSLFDEERGDWESNLWSRTQGRLAEAIKFGYAGEPVSGSDIWEVVSPWHATYWKTLFQGHHVRLRTKTRQELSSSDEAKQWENTLLWYRLPL